MKCPVLGKPILDPWLYTKNRCWRVPGSTKGAEWPGKNQSLPEKNFFIQTRMSDRRGRPTSSASELGIFKERHHKRKLNPNPRPHTHARGGKKRGLSGMVTSDSQASACKRRNHRLALTTSAMSLSNTPGPDPSPVTVYAKRNSKQSPHQSPLQSRSWLVLNRRHDCPITGCNNYGGKRYMESTIMGHLHTHSNVIRDSPAEKAKAL